jgi:uncharacterized protein
VTGPLAPKTPSVPRPILVIYHGQCADGFTSAWAAWRAFGDRAEYLAAAHEERPAPPVSGREVYILDFSFSRPQTLEMLKTARALHVIDHHETARRELAGLACVHFDNTKSGSLLAWEHFHPHHAAPLLIEHVTDRDLQLWKNPHSRAFLAWMERVPRTFRNWERLTALSPRAYQQILAKGRTVLAEQNRIALKIADTSVPIRVQGESGLAVACPLEFSPDVGSILAKRCGSFGFTWRLLPDQRVRVLLRSVASFSVGDLAQSMGGGGHHQAAGCVVSVPELLAMLLP